MIAAQQKLLKPDPKANVIADTRTDLDWLDAGLSYQYTLGGANTFVADLESTGALAVLTRWEDSVLFSTSVEVGKGWRLPGINEVTDFIAGWSDPSGNWINWLEHETGGLGVASVDGPAAPLAPNGVWTTDVPGLRFTAGIDTRGFFSTGSRSGGVLRSPFLVKTRAHSYW